MRCVRAGRRDPGLPFCLVRIGRSAHLWHQVAARRPVVERVPAARRVRRRRRGPISTRWDRPWARFLAGAARSMPWGGQNPGLTPPAPEHPAARGPAVAQHVDHRRLPHCARRRARRVQRGELDGDHRRGRLDRPVPVAAVRRPLVGPGAKAGQRPLRHPGPARPCGSEEGRASPLTFPPTQHPWESLLPFSEQWREPLLRAVNGSFPHAAVPARVRASPDYPGDALYQRQLYLAQCNANSTCRTELGCALSGLRVPLLRSHASLPLPLPAAVAFAWWTRW